jgi:DtxR family Mn-dependent transcriptional regulator
VDVIGLEYEQVHEEACRWEHVMSEAVERKLLTLLNHPRVSPFGNPIPGLDALGGDTAAVLDALTLLSTTATPEGRQVVVKRISEQLQEDAELLRSLAEQGVRPGSTVTATVSNGAVLVDGVALQPGVAQHVFVSAVDEDLTPEEAAEATAGVG